MGIVIRTFTTAIIAIFFGLIVNPLGAHYSAIGSAIVFAALETLPRVSLNKIEQMRKDMESVLSDHFYTNIKLDFVSWGGTPFKLKSDVQPVYNVVEGLGRIQGRPYDEIWVIFGSWYFGVLKNKKKVIGIKGSEVTIILEE